MHTYLRAIGFSKCRSRRQLEHIYSSTLKSANRKIVTTIGIDTSLVQFEKDFGKSMGLALVGECDIEGNLSIEHYYPYIKGEVPTSFERITIEKQTDKESYAGVCDDYRLGMTLIFYVINTADYAKSRWLNYSNRNITDMKFSALSVSGTVLLGIGNSKKQRNSELDSLFERYKLLAAARGGNNEAMDDLAINDMNIYATVNSRVKTEDVLTIVRTSFMPCGVECDHYMVVGNIIKVEEIVNSMSGELVYNLLLEVNDIMINVGINSLDLQGEPAEGRRFRGEIWLQGIIQI